MREKGLGSAGWAPLGTKGEGWPMLGAHTPRFYHHTYTILRSKHRLEGEKNCMGTVLAKWGYGECLWPPVAL